MTISKKKRTYPVSENLWAYLQDFRRKIQLPLTYEELRYFKQSFPLRNTQGKDTLWETALYDSSEVGSIHEGLKKMYSILRTEGDETVHEHLHVERVDYCTFGNSNPFRIKIVNNFNDNYDYFYVKQADASRIYGLEMEHILSPERINFYADKNTLVEEHIAGIPGDQFIQNNLVQKDLNKTRVAKEFVKFNERCLVRLLGDMRSYNYVFDLTPDFEEVQYRIRAIDFDQQSYEGRRSLYLPQFFKENNPVVWLCSTCLNLPTMKQYQEEERSLIARRYISENQRISALLECMRTNPAEPPEKVIQLAQELGEYHKSDAFDDCHSMGEIVARNLEVTLARHIL